MNGFKDPKTELLDAVNSRETPSQKVRQIAASARLSERQGLSENVLSMLKEHNESVDCLKNDCDRSLQQLMDAVTSCTDSDDFSQLFSAAEETRTDVPILAQQAVRLCTRAIEISQAMATDLAARSADLEAEAERIVAKVKGQLTKIGCGIEAQQASLHNNGPAAERQFDNLARNFNVHSRAAIGEANSARADNSALQESIYRYRSLQDEAKKLLVQVARRAIAG